jgi:hypothetical protein
LGTQGFVDDLHWGFKARYLVAFFVSVSPHVGVACFSIYGEDVAKTIAIPVAYVYKLAVSLGLEDVALRTPGEWIWIESADVSILSTDVKVVGSNLLEQLDCAIGADPEITKQVSVVCFGSH